MGFTGEQGGQGQSLFLGLVGQHRVSNKIADGEKSRDAGGIILIHLQKSSIRRSFGIDSRPQRRIDIRPAAHSHQYFFNIEVFKFALFFLPLFLP